MTQIYFEFNHFKDKDPYFLNLEKSQKKRKVLLWISTVLFLLLTLLSLFIQKKYPGKDFNFWVFTLHGSSHTVRIFQSLAGVLLVFFPLFLEWAFKVRMSFVNILFYEIYLFMALGIGSVLEGFVSIKSYDDVAHFMAGGLGAIVGISAWLNSIDQPRKKKNGKPFLAPGYAFGLFMVGFFGVLWEIWEYAVDSFLPQRDAQRTHNPDGTPRLGRDAIWDTMKDLTVNILGALFGLVLASLVNRACKGNYDRQFLILKDPRKQSKA